MKDRGHLGEPAVRQTLMDDVVGGRCTLCGKRSKNVDTISWVEKVSLWQERRGIVGETMFSRYHLTCVKNVLVFGEEVHGKHKVDVAIKISEKLKLRKARQRAHDLLTLKDRVAGIKQKEERQHKCNHALHELNQL